MARRALKGLGGLLWSIVIASVAVMVWVMILFPAERGPGDGRAVRLSIDDDATVDEVASWLEAEGVLERPFAWTFYMRLLGADERLREGLVHLRDDMSVAEVSRRVAKGLGRYRTRIVVPEGYDRFDVAERLDEHGVADAEAFLRAVEDPRLLEELGIPAGSAEGYLFPDTYELRNDTPPSAIVRRMVGTFRRRTGPIFVEEASGAEWLNAQLGFGAHEALILASVVEKEAARAEERPVIAGVFLNRLRSSSFLPRHRLQADPTVAYGCRLLAEIIPSCEGFRGRLDREMLTDSGNPYNTYRHGGLPPGPIANPGLSALRAVLAPARHDYLYFVAKGGGRHQFSETLDAHERSVDRYIRGE